MGLHGIDRVLYQLNFMRCIASGYLCPLTEHEGFSLGPRNMRAVLIGYLIAHRNHRDKFSCSGKIIIGFIREVWAVFL